MKLNWRPHTSRPMFIGPESCLIASDHEDGKMFVVGLCNWVNGAFRYEDDGRAPREPFFWLPESELFE